MLDKIWVARIAITKGKVLFQRAMNGGLSLDTPGTPPLHCDEGVGIKINCNSCLLLFFVIKFGCSSSLFGRPVQE